MIRRLFLVACAMGAVAAAAQAATDAAAGAPTAAQIVERNVAAHGGLTAWRAVGTLTLSGQLDAGGKPNVELPFVLKMKRGHKSRLEIRFQDKTALQVYDGKQGWKVRPFLNRDEVEPYTPAEAKLASAWEELDGPLIDHAAKGTKVELTGTETIDGSETYRLKLTLKSGEQRDLWVDAKTFLETKIEGEPRKMDGKPRSVAVFYRAYKTENGLTTARQLETVVDGVKQARRMIITTVVANASMDDALFQKPRITMAKAQ